MVFMDKRSRMVSDILTLVAFAITFAGTLVNNPGDGLSVTVAKRRQMKTFILSYTPNLLSQIIKQLII